MKAGYKKTDVGVIPEEWEVRPFTQVTDLITCGIAATPDYVPESQGFPFLSSSNVKEGRIVWSGFKHISADLHRQLYRNNPPKRGDILYSRVGTFGEAAVVDVDFEFSVYVSLTLIKPSKTLDSCFLMQLLNSNAYKQRAKDQIYLGGGVGNLNVDVVRRYPVVVPPLPEQRAIAEALSDVDALLGGLDRLIAKKRDLKQAAMQQLLTGQTRLPGYHGVWRDSTVGSEFEIKLGKMLDAEKNVGVPKPFIGNRAVQWGRINIDDLATVPLTRADIERFRLRKGDLLVCEGGEVGRAAIWDAPLNECYFQKALHRLRPLRDFNVTFMAALLQLWSAQGKFANYVTQTSIAHLPREKFVQMPLLVPEPAEQTAIAEVLTEIDAELAALEQRREKTRALKQAMMQELLTGRTRLI